MRTVSRRTSSGDAPRATRISSPRPDPASVPWRDTLVPDHPRSIHPESPVRSRRQAHGEHVQGARGPQQDPGVPHEVRQERGDATQGMRRRARRRRRAQALPRLPPGAASHVPPVRLTPRGRGDALEVTPGPRTRLTARLARRQRQAHALRRLCLSETSR